MDCPDCHGRHEQLPAMGICRQCGAAVCATHSAVQGQSYAACCPPSAHTGRS